MPTFEPVPTRVAFPVLEQRILDFWRERDIFARSVEARPADRVFSFYEGPPTANGNPGIHHVLARVFKDLLPRYKTMRGYRVPRKGGWDTHGLPVELEVERQLGLRSKPDIEAYGVEAFNRQCRESVFRYVAEWERMTERIGYWVDLSDAYVTYSREYVETCWWIFKRLWDHGLMFSDYRTTPHCPRCETSLSSHEIALGYKDDTPDPSVFVRFRVPPSEIRRVFGEGARRRLGSGAPTALSGLVPPSAQLSFLAWTTTPWTLPGNSALAVNADAEYALAAVGDERLVVALARVADVLGPDARTLAVLHGRDLVGMRYEPLYDAGAWSGVQPRVFRDGRWQPPLDDTPLPERRVVAADFVATDDGSGIVHIAPAFGEDDHQLGRREGLLFLQPVSTSGRMIGGPWDGVFVKDADPAITRDLDARGLLWREARIRHTYPFCWRCDAPVLYYAKPSWYIRTTAVRDALIAGNARIHWVPEHIRDGRFGEWLEGNVDWAVSRERYWGTPLPLWACAECGTVDCIGSYAELRARSGAADEIADPHRPYIDAVTIACACGSTMRRVPEVADAWFDSGAMPYAQWHYPFEHADTFASRFPADYICEAVDQTRGWFYTLHALATLLHRTEDVPDSLAYCNVICLGHILDGDGLKMSKSRGNVVDPWTVLDEHGADALRWYLYTASPPGNSRRFSTELVGETSRRFLATLWSTYSFFVTYANIANFDPSSAPNNAGPPLDARSELDRWVLGELASTVLLVTAGLDAYEPADAARPIETFVEQLSNWYVRRSRRRFWKSDDSADTQAALWTLYECLVTVTRLLAPFTPFVAEELHRNLIAGKLPGARDSVHLDDWPSDPDVGIETISLAELAQLGSRTLGTVGARAARIAFAGTTDSGYASHVHAFVDRGHLTIADAHTVLMRFVPGALIDDQVRTNAELVQRLVSLGRAARQQANVRVRQPLAELVVVVRTGEERAAVARFADEIADELNVKRVTAGDGADPRLSYTLRPNLPVLGPRFGRELGAVRAALAEADPAAVAAHMRAGEPLGVPGFELTAADVLVAVAAVPGWAAAEEAGYVALLDTTLTPELAAEGLARELVRRLQELRREAGLDVTDRIRVAWQGDVAVAAAIEAHRAHIEGEVLALALAPGDPAALGQAAHAATATLDGHTVTLALIRA